MRTRSMLMMLIAGGLVLAPPGFGAIYTDPDQQLGGSRYPFQTTADPWPGAGQPTSRLVSPLQSAGQQLQSAGFSQRMMSSLQPNANRQDTARSGVVTPVQGQDLVLPPIQVPPGGAGGGSGALPALPPIDVAAPAGAGSGGGSPLSSVGGTPRAGRSSGRKSGGNGVYSTGAGTVGAAGSPEVYSQEAVRLPPIEQLPYQPDRTVLPPLRTNRMLEVPLVEADSITRVLACNAMGLTGLTRTTSADVSRAGSFKMGMHSSWFNLDRVYDRPLATNEDGDLLEIPLFFNYAVTDDLEIAYMLPILNYTVKSRILWSRDYRESGVGDSKLSFKYRVFDNHEYQMRGGFGVGFKFPTGSDAKGLGTGKTDFEIFTAFSKTFEKVTAHVHLGYIMTGDPNTQFYPDGLADIFYYNVGLEYPHTHNVTVMAELNGHDWGAEGLSLDVTPGLRYTPTENFALEVAVPVSVTNDQRFGYNYKIITGLTAFFK